jgi:hypothetical protein
MVGDGMSSIDVALDVDALFDRSIETMCSIMRVMRSKATLWDAAFVSEFV